MARVESEFDASIKKDHVYLITRAAQSVADRISEKNALPREIFLKITSRPQASDAHISYSDWKIVLDYNSMNVQKALIEQRALEGLLAHEMMHIAQKLDGTEGEVVRLFSREFEERGLKGRMFGLMKDLGMVTKDLFVNDRLVEQGFGEELFKHYLIVVHSRVLDNVFPFAELDRDRLDDFFVALAGLFPAYASFYRKGEQDRAEIIKSSINRHFSDIPPEIRAVLDEMEASLLLVTLTEKGIHRFVEDLLRAHSRLLSQ